MAFEGGARRERSSAEHVLCLRGRQLQALCLDPAEQIPGKIQILLLPCGAIQLDQRHLEFGMSGESRLLVRSEPQYQVIGVANSRIQKLAFTGHAIIRDRRLQQMPEAVKLMRAVHLLETF